MERFDLTGAMPERWRGGVIALGNFDGFHKGHQAVVGRAIEKARAKGAPALVATFDPHPVRLFRPDALPFGLTTLEQRARLFAGSGADAMAVLRFDKALAALTAEEFVARHLAAFSAVVTGQDFTFGKARSGNVAALTGFERKYGLEVEAVAPVAEGDEIISSSRIREALQAGDCDTATRLLTRPFTVEGVVQHGDKNGRNLGYPTANIEMGQYLRPRYGVYAVRGRLPDGRIVDGAANMGIRPQFEPPKELLEPHFFDLSEDLYGQTIEVEFHAFIRPEAKFETLDALKAQIEQDCKDAIRLFA